LPSPFSFVSPVLPLRDPQATGVDPVGAFLSLFCVAGPLSVTEFCGAIKEEPFLEPPTVVFNLPILSVYCSQFVFTAGYDPLGTFAFFLRSFLSFQEPFFFKYLPTFFIEAEISSPLTFYVSLPPDHLGMLSLVCLFSFFEPGSLLVLA